MWRQRGGRAGRLELQRGWGRPSHLALPCLRVPPIFPHPSGHLSPGQGRGLGAAEPGDGDDPMARWPGSTPFPSTNTLALPRVPPPTCWVTDFTLTCSYLLTLPSVPHFPSTGERCGMSMAVLTTKLCSLRFQTKLQAGWRGLQLPATPRGFCPGTRPFESGRVFPRPGKEPSSCRWLFFVCSESLGHYEAPAGDQELSSSQPLPPAEEGEGREPQAAGAGARALAEGRHGLG